MTGQRPTARRRRRRAGHSRRGQPVRAARRVRRRHLLERARGDRAAADAARRPGRMVDLRMPDVGGLDVLRAIREIDPRCQAVLMTGYASVDTAVEAIKLGAMDYLSKPLDFARLEQLLTGVRDELERRRSLLSIESDVARRLEFCGMIGRGPLMQELFGMIRRLAPHVRTALITGETGTGKELVARALHQTGPAPRPPVRHRQLLGGRRDAVRERAVRPRARRVHRRDRQQAGPVRARRRRHAVPRRDRRAAAVGAGEAAARARARRGAPRRLARAAHGQRPRASPRPTAICARKWPPGGSAATSTTASTSSK